MSENKVSVLGRLVITNKKNFHASAIPLERHGVP